MTKHAEELMDPATFAGGVQLNKLRLGYFLTHPRSADQHPLKQIHRKLTEYRGKDKAMLVDRHRLMGEIIDLCDYYIGSKDPRKQGSAKVNTVVKLANQARTRLLTEQTRASALEQKINNPGSGANVGSGGFNSGLRFERVAKPGGMAVKGDELYHKAPQLGNIQLTGDDVNDFYALKKLLKRVDRSTIEGAGMAVLAYLDEEERAQYEVEITSTQLRWADTGDPLHTVGNLGGDPPATTMFAADLNGRFYALHYWDLADTQGRFAHSSFLAGDNVLCAGTLKASNGRLLEISNLSGHYTPGLQHLVDACEAIMVGRMSPQGYDPAKDGYVIFGDMGNPPVFPVTNGKQTQFYRFPMKLFARNSRQIKSFLDYECCTQLTAKKQGGKFTYTNPEAAVRAGCTLPVA